MTRPASATIPVPTSQGNSFLPVNMRICRCSYSVARTRLAIIHIERERERERERARCRSRAQGLRACKSLKLVTLNPKPVFSSGWGERSGPECVVRLGRTSLAVPMLLSVCLHRPTCIYMYVCIYIYTHMQVFFHHSRSSKDMYFDDTDEDP